MKDGAAEQGYGRLRKSQHWTTHVSSPVTPTDLRVTFPVPLPPNAQAEERVARGHAAAPRTYPLLGAAGLERAPELLAAGRVLRVVVQAAPVQVARAPARLPLLPGRCGHPCGVTRERRGVRPHQRLPARTAPRGPSPRARARALRSWVPDYTRKLAATAPAAG